MDSNQTVCPVCTLYLRPGITLKSHLASHPKQKVIEALIKLTGDEKAEDGGSTSQQVNIQTFNHPSPSTTPMPGNHLFIYQQSMSTSNSHATSSNVLNLNPLGQQYVIPTVFNPQMMPYVYQQQQVIMSSNGVPPLRALPFDIPSSSTNSPIITEEEDLIITEAESKLTCIEEDLQQEEDTTIEEEQDLKLDSDEHTSSNSNKVNKLDKDEDVEDYEDHYEHTSEPSETPQSKDWPDFDSKACQTASDTNINQSEEDYFYIEQPQEAPTTNQYDTDPIYTSENILQGNEIIEMDGMQVIINDFNATPIISQVEHFEARPDRSTDLMTIGDMVHLEDTSQSQNSQNMRTDERMPPRGELSGQESCGASDNGWNRLNYQQERDEDEEEGTSGGYDLTARESWQHLDASTIVTCPEPLQFKCQFCEELFDCALKRQEHQDKHLEDRKINIIGSEIGKKKVKKIIVKPKPETTFDNVFTNKLKLETQTDPASTSHQTVDLPPVKLKDDLVDLKVMCSICDTVLKDTKALRAHKQEIHQVTPEIRHKCQTCSEAFQNEFKYTEHLRIHPLECRMCGKLFYRRQNFQLHMKRHLGLKPYKCELCNKCFVTKQKHDEHKNTHTGEAPIKCTMCNETFRRHSNLAQHRNRHHFQLKKKVKDYICSCGEIFHSKKKLAWHKEIHDAKPKSCTKCSEKFVHMSSLTRHMRRAHNEKFLPNQERSNENVECPICKGVYLRSSLEVHIRNHSGQRPYTCLICNKDFTTKWNLKLHKWTHASRTSKPFKCDQCKGAFIRESDYTAHMNSHKSVRPYTCNYCGAQFIRKYNCQRHVKEHEQGKTFNCQICGKSFHRSYYLKDHMRVHSGVRPYACHICGKTSTTKSNHNKHVQIHHAREPVSTEN